MMTTAIFFFGVLLGIWATICYASLVRWSAEEHAESERKRWRTSARTSAGARERGPYAKAGRR
jgi:hypothetical protein